MGRRKQNNSNRVYVGTTAYGICRTAVYQPAQSWVHGVLKYIYTAVITLRGTGTGVYSIQQQLSSSLGNMYPEVLLVMKTRYPAGVFVLSAAVGRNVRAGAHHYVYLYRYFTWYSLL